MPVVAPDEPAYLPQRPTASRIRAAHFPRTRHGYQPNAVHEYLGRVADEILRLHQRLAQAYAETDRIKRHLRQWQTNHATTCRRPDPQPVGGPPNAPAPARWVTQPPYPPAHDR